ncbi:MAG TPA: hypothetical protein VKG01_10700 [Thermoanaerobaculia bacterium]|nr:hypothetical protein [Thermoanaerobaculia bacterium]
MKSCSRALFVATAVAALLVSACRKSESPEASAADTEAAKQARARPPFGLIDTPKENDAIASGAQGTGWALDDSGIAKVEVALDEGPRADAKIGQPFPGVHEAYPNYPDSDKAGFTFTIPSVAAGPHLLIVSVTAKDGGKTDLRRHIQIR